MEKEILNGLLASIPKKETMFKSAYWNRIKSFVAIKHYNSFENTYVIETIKGIPFCVPENELTRFCL